MRMYSSVSKYSILRYTWDVQRVIERERESQRRAGRQTGTATGIGKAKGCLPIAAR
jgi:hypothetical protein